jgi:hypothetical protein
LISAYHFLLRHTAFPQHSILPAVPPLPRFTEGWQARLAMWLEVILALLGTLLALNLATGALVIVHEIERLVTVPVRNQVHTVKLAVASYMLITSLTLSALSLFLVVVEARMESQPGSGPADLYRGAFGQWSCT